LPTMSQNPAGEDKEKRHPLALPEGINKRCDLPPEAYWVSCRPRIDLRNTNTMASITTALITLRMPFAPPTTPVA
jgi:hypothetical protein